MLEWSKVYVHITMPNWLQLPLCDKEWTPNSDLFKSDLSHSHEVPNQKRIWFLAMRHGREWSSEFMFLLIYKQRCALSSSVSTGSEAKQQWRRVAADQLFVVLQSKCDAYNKSYYVLHFARFNTISRHTTYSFGFFLPLWGTDAFTFQLHTGHLEF